MPRNPIHPADAAVPSDTTSPRSDERALIRRLECVGKLVAGCHARMGSPLGAEDLEEAIQETSLTAWRRRLEFRGDSDIDTLLYGIARFTILARIRRLRNRDWCEVDVVGAPAPCTPERSPGTLADTGIVRVVSDCLDDAGTTVAEIFRRRILMEMSFVRISKDLNVKEANVKARYYRSLPRLRRSLGRLWSDLGRG